MRRARRTFGAAVTAALLTPAALARGDDAQPADDPWGDVEGHVRAGLRLLSGEGEGRFRQERSLDDGPRIFDLEARGGERASPFGLTEWELSAHGLGDANQDARVRVRRDETLDVSAGWMRDDFSYVATGDPFPYDTVRERGEVRVRVRPSRELTLRLDYDRSLRRGDAYTIGDTDRRDPNVAVPGNGDRDFVQVHRPLRQESDTATLGADWRTGDWRFSLAQTGRLAQIDDTRQYAILPSRGAPSPVDEDLRRDVRSTAWTTVAKAGVTLLDGDLDVDAIGSFTVQPVRTRYGGSAHGYDTVFDIDANQQRGNYSAVIDGTSRLDRDRTDLRLEALWRVAEDVEIVVSAESDETVDDAELRYEEHRVYDDADVAPFTATTERDARITDRGCRASAEAAWDVTEELRLRLGEEWYRQVLEVPFSNRATSLLPTDFAATSWRTIAGADWKPMPGLDLSLFAKFGQNDEPHSTPSSESSDEVSWRGRWKASETLSVATTYRHKGFRHSDDLDAATRSDSTSLSASWTPGDWTVSPSVTWQTLDTRADTLLFRPFESQVAFHTRDLIASLDVRCAITQTLRWHLTGTRVESHGDRAAVWDDVSLGAEHDLSDAFTVGADLLYWRLDEERDFDDDYSVLGVEFFVTWRF